MYDLSSGEIQPHDRDRADLLVDRFPGVGLPAERSDDSI